MRSNFVLPNEHGNVNCHSLTEATRPTFTAETMVIALSFKFVTFNYQLMHEGKWRGERKEKEDKFMLQKSESANG